MRVILISGRKRSGKDTIAEYLCDKLGTGTLVLPNAKAVKEEAFDTFRWDGEKDEKGRRLLVDITNTGYNYDPFFWEKRTVEQISALLQMGMRVDTVIIPDWRYECTYDFFMNVEATGLNINELVTLRVERLISVEQMCDPTDSFDVYKSESQLDGFPVDYVISNKGTKEELHALLDTMLANGEIISDTED